MLLSLITHTVLPILSLSAIFFSQTQEPTAEHRLCSTDVVGVCHTDVLALFILTSMYNSQHCLSLFHNVQNGHFNRNIPSDFSVCGTGCTKPVIV